MKPVVLCRNSSGRCVWSQSWMNCEALAAPCGVIGPLLVMMPMTKPAMRAQPHTVWLSYSFLNSRKSEPSTSRAITSFMSKGFFGSAGTRPGSSSAG